MPRNISSKNGKRKLFFLMEIKKCNFSESCSSGKQPISLVIPENIKKITSLILGTSDLGLFWVMHPNVIPKTELQSWNKQSWIVFLLLSKLYIFSLNSQDSYEITLKKKKSSLKPLQELFPLLPHNHTNQSNLLLQDDHTAPGLWMAESGRTPRQDELSSSPAPGWSLWVLPLSDCLSEWPCPAWAEPQSSGLAPGAARAPSWSLPALIWSPSSSATTMRMHVCVCSAHIYFCTHTGGFIHIPQQKPNLQGVNYPLRDCY